MSGVVGCHQPNFFPWLGYFHKMRWSDTFVLLDDVAIQKTGGSVTNRTQLFTGGKPAWFTAPIDRSFSGTLAISEVRFAPRDRFREKLAATLRQAYARAPCFASMWPELQPLVENPEEKLGAYNMTAIRRIAALLELPPKIVASSTLAIDATSTERLVAIVKRVEGDTYLVGGGAKDYQDDTMFERNGIRLLEQRFAPPTYPRGTQPEAAGLSVLDALFFLGPAGTRALLDARPPGGSP